MIMAKPPPNLMPLKRIVVFVTQEADPNDDSGIRKAVKRWHNKLANGSIPRPLFKKIGRELYLDLDLFREWLNQQQGEI